MSVTVVSNIYAFLSDYLMITHWIPIMLHENKGVCRCQIQTKTANCNCNFVSIYNQIPNCEKVKRKNKNQPCVVRSNTSIVGSELKALTMSKRFSGSTDPSSRKYVTLQVRRKFILLG